MVSLRGLLVNAVVGLVILIVSNAIGLGVQISLVTLLICAVLGIPGAILVIALATLDIAFMASVLPAVGAFVAPAVVGRSLRSVVD